MIEVNGWLIEKFFRPLFRRFSKHGGKVYFDKKLFPITKTLEGRTRLYAKSSRIYEIELKTLLHSKR